MEYEQWPDLYRVKLEFCHEAANFQADSKKNPEQFEFKEKKRETIIELIDILDEGETAEEFLHTEEILREAMIMIEKNIFRTFQNKSKLTANFEVIDPMLFIFR